MELRPTTDEVKVASPSKALGFPFSRNTPTGAGSPVKRAPSKPADHSETLPPLAIDHVTGDTYYSGFQHLGNFIDMEKYVLINPDTEAPGVKPHVGQILCLWTQRNNERTVEIRRLLRPEEMPTGRKPYHAPSELILTDHIEEYPLQKFNDNAFFVSWEFTAQKKLVELPREQLIPRLQTSPRTAQLQELQQQQQPPAPPTYPVANNTPAPAARAPENSTSDNVFDRKPTRGKHIASPQPVVLVIDDNGPPRAEIKTATTPARKPRSQSQNINAEFIQHMTKHTPVKKKRDEDEVLEGDGSSTPDLSEQPSEPQQQQLHRLRALRTTDKPDIAEKIKQNAKEQKTKRATKPRAPSQSSDKTLNGFIVPDGAEDSAHEADEEDLAAEETNEEEEQIKQAMAASLRESRAKRQQTRSSPPQSKAAPIRIDLESGSEEPSTMIIEPGRKRHKEEPKKSALLAAEEACGLVGEIPLAIHPLRESFCIYMQFLTSQLIDSSFVASLESTDDYFWAAVKRIEARVCDMKEMVARSSVWHDTFKRDIETLPEYQCSPNTKHLGADCDACMRQSHSATIEIRLSGMRYDAAIFWKHTEMLEELFPASENHLHTEEESLYRLGSNCAKRTHLFHELHHYKYSLSKTIYRHLLKSSESDPAERRLNFVMDDDRFVNESWQRFNEVLNRASEFNERRASDT